MAFLSFPEAPFELLFCFDQVITTLETTAADPQHGDAGKAQQLLDDIAMYPELRTGIEEDSPVLKQPSLINRLMTDYFPPALTNNEIKAINLPYSDFTLNHTERFKKILSNAGQDFKINIRDFDQHKFYVMSCCLILNEYYGTRLDFSQPLFYDIPDNGIAKHYRILYNGDFLDVLPTPQSVTLTEEDIDELMNNYHDLALWKAKFPLKSWILKGFAIVTLFDATVENAVSLLKEQLLGLNGSKFQQSMEGIFQSIYKIPDVRIGFTIFDEDTERLSLNGIGTEVKSFIVSNCADTDACDILCGNSYQALVEEKVYFAVSDTQVYLASGPSSRLVNMLNAQGIRSFILAPIVKDEKLLGVLEIVSSRPKELNTINANKLDIVMPFLTDAVERLISQLQNQVEAVIQEKYTSIHPSVYWKFREEARQYINGLYSGQDYSLKEIIFSGVYPLYGEVDIKGSSETRNESAKSDIKTQLKTLLELLQAINESDELKLSLHKEARRVENYLYDITASLQAGAEQLISSYLEASVHPALEKISQPAFLSRIAAYFKETSKEEGGFHLHRRQYETTISKINSKLATVLDQSQQKAQSIYPHYYERFKTDGIEHNLYIGPMIAPHYEFTVGKLQELRLWQVQVLCEMERAHYKIQGSLPYPFDVTTLILVHHSPIAIRFRMDEKRFDVDGSYNARYEIIKKRIDKAHIKGSTERITQPGMLTIVYSNATDELEYEQYINVLEERGLLQKTSLEKIMVEDLQGVTGMKALRVKINHEVTRKELASITH